MNALLQNLIEALREELKQYGEMLALLDHQQQLVILRQGSDLMQSVAAVDAQAEVIRIAREEREQRQRDLARKLKLEEAIGLQDLTLHLPNDYQPLVNALVQENNSLLVRVQQRARQNHLLLNRAIELMQRFITTLVPGVTPVTYTPEGRRQASEQSARALYEAIG
ncbi:MAG TPA: flagellar export chaperone FlgN [Clostridia bacterium]|nr:flagellar export chaperone FlgN [Clostridia bacterium]